MTNIILVVLIFIGFGLIIFSVLKKEEKFQINIDEAKAIQEALEASIEDADNAISELNGLCSNAFEEFEEKYQELLFLYQMIQDKKEENSFYSKEKNSAEKEIVVEKNNTSSNKKSATNKKIVDKPKKTNYTNPKLKDILKLQNQGLSIAEIAKKLNMGQGEVKLIAELGKER